MIGIYDKLRNNRDYLEKIYRDLVNIFLPSFTEIFCLELETILQKIWRVLEKIWWGFEKIETNRGGGGCSPPPKRPVHKFSMRIMIAEEKPVWRLSEEHLADGEQLIDAHALLTDEDRERPSVPLATGTFAICWHPTLISSSNPVYDFLSAVCAPSPGSRAQASGARRACKNCTCGLAEQLDRESIAAAADAPASATPTGSTSRSACGSVGISPLFFPFPYSSPSVSSSLWNCAPSRKLYT